MGLVVDLEPEAWLVVVQTNPHIPTSFLSVAVEKTAACCHECSVVCGRAESLILLLPLLVLVGLKLDRGAPGPCEPELTCNTSLEQCPLHPARPGDQRCRAICACGFSISFRSLTLILAVMALDFLVFGPVDLTRCCLNSPPD